MTTAATAKHRGHDRFSLPDNDKTERWPSFLFASSCAAFLCVASLPPYIY